MSARIQAVGDFVMDCMDEIASRFKAGARVTVLVRMPDFPDGSRDMLVTADDLDAIIKAIQLRKAAS